MHSDICTRKFNFSRVIICWMSSCTTREELPPIIRDIWNYSTEAKCRWIV